MNEEVLVAKNMTLSDLVSISVRPVPRYQGQLLLCLTVDPPPQSMFPNPERTVSSSVKLFKNSASEPANIKLGTPSLKIVGWTTSPMIG